ncbi:hypothetical protein N7505_000335 [Penicillium chrysogenum]|uniref:Uncharacterized protein n=1 Tax=Penicillium chrysogenum TaxID=5076 RepID=A0ABQ8WTQ5_PENCH|nr:hypothetical protein N7505_000335 [Penicillium chrysogenum]
MSSNGVISLAELMNHHRDLLVQPICWTSRHLEMLGCRFEHFDHVPTPTDDINPDANTWRPIYNDNELEKRPDLFYEESFAEGHFSLCPHVQFRIHRPQYSVFYRSRKRSQPADKAPRPIIGYMHYRGVEKYRQEMFPFSDPPEGYCNRPGGQIQLKRVAQITPKNWSEDPYLLCVLLSLAQLQEYHRKEWHPPIHVSRLFLTHEPGEEFFHIFEAHITSELLEMLDNPTTATKHIDWPIIRHRRVPYYPLEDLRERIQTEIARDQPPGTFDISDPVHRILLPGGRRDYSEDADTIHIQRRKEVKKRPKGKLKKRVVRRSETGSW